MREGTGQKVCSRAPAPGGRGRDLVTTVRGFTLIEVLIAIAIVVAIGALVLVNFLPAKEQADISLQRVQFDQLDAAMKSFKLDLKRWPTEDEGLAVLVRKDVMADESEAGGWRGPYLDGGLPKDQWKHDIIYHIPSEALGEGYYDLISMGPDGQEGTSDDITNHDRLKNAEGEIEGTPGGGGRADDAVPPPVRG
jgi:general secretion pathway protein G